MNLKLFLIVLFALPLTASVSIAQTSESESLRGLKAFRVVVGNVRTTSLPRNAKPDTPTSEEVKTETELWLKKFGVNTAESEDVNVPILYVTLLSEKDNDGVNHFNLGVHLTQMVTLVRDPSIKIRALTWGYDTGGSASGTRPFDGMICRAVAPFINAYLLANGARVPLDEAAMCMQ